MQRSIVCEACKVFEPIFEYHAITNARKNIKPEFLLLDIVLIVKTFGGEVGGFGGEASPPPPPPHPPVDETLEPGVGPGFGEVRVTLHDYPHPLYTFFYISKLSLMFY